MHIVAQVFGVLVAVYATRHIAIKDLASLEGTNWGLHCLDLLATALAGYVGTVAALDAPWWAFLAGLGPVIVWSGVLLGRILHRRHVLRKLAEQYLAWCPHNTLTSDTTFSEAVSIALHRCRLTDVSRLIRFPFDTLKSVFATRVHVNGWLNFEDFRAECTAFWACGDKCDFGAQAPLLVFVDPPAVIQSRRWLWEYTVLLKKSYSLKEMELVNLIRFIWKSQILDREIQLDCTQRAFETFKTKPKMAKTLCLTLLNEHPDDAWVHRQLFSKLASLGRIKVDSIIPLERLNMARWHAQGNERECLVCGDKPLEKPSKLEKFVPNFLKRSIQNFRSRDCGFCHLDTLEDLMIENNVPGGSGGHQDGTPLDEVIVQA